MQLFKKNPKKEWHMLKCLQHTIKKKGQSKHTYIYAPLISVHKGLFSIITYLNRREVI